MAEGAQRQARADVGDLVVGELARGRHADLRRQRRRMRPQPLGPVVHHVPGIEHVQRVHRARAVDAELVEVEVLCLQAGDGLADQLAGADAVTHRAVGIVGAVVRGGVVGCDDIGVGEAPAGVVSVVVAHRAVVAEAGVALLVAEVVDLGLRDRAGHVGELHQHAQAHVAAHAGVLRRRGHRTGHAARGVGDQRLAVLLAPYLPARLGAERRLCGNRGATSRGRLHAQVLAQRGGWCLVGADAVCNQRVRIGREVRVFVEAGGRVAHHGIALGRLEMCVELVTPTDDAELRAVGVGEGEALAEKGHAHGGPPSAVVVMVMGSCDQPIRTHL